MRPVNIDLKIHKCRGQSSLKTFQTSALSLLGKYLLWYTEGASYHNGRFNHVDMCCTNLQIRLAFSSYKVSNMFSIKDPIPFSLRSLVVYKFSCAGCNSVYVGETCRHFSTRAREHLARDKNSHIYKHPNSSKTCKKLSLMRAASPF